ncbi:ribonuclease H [Vibrio phage vB_pir03]|nr:ribonuclease H [Vibrio phage vB_pir03]
MKSVTIHTDGGATADAEVGYYGGWGVHISVDEEDTELLICAACPHGDTNNRAEQRAYIRAMKWVLENDVTYARFILDSKYVIEGSMQYIHIWEANNWVTKEGKPVKNRDLWIMIDALQQQMQSKNIKYRLDWVKGHSGKHGNEMADQGATRGTAFARASDFDERILDVKSMQEEVEAKAAERKKVKAVDPFGLLCGRRMLEVMNAERMTVDGKRAYMTCSYDDTDPIKARGLGVHSGERFEGLVVPNEQLEAYETVVNHQESILSDSLIRPTIVYWDKLKSTQTWKQLALDGIGIFLQRRDDLVLSDKATPITKYLNPPRQARRCLESMTNKKEIIESLLAGGDYDRIDVTDLFFEENAKGKLAIRPDIAKEKSVEYNWKVDSRTARIIMAFDYEIPNRNSLAKTLKQGKEIKCELIITDRTENTFRWHMLVTTPIGYGLFNNPSTNLYVLPH